MKRFLFFVTLSLLLFLTTADAYSACAVNGNIQSCQLHVTWDWAQGTGGAADGFLLQRQINGGAWNDDMDHIDVTSRALDETYANDPGNTTLCYQMLAWAWATDGRLWSSPSNTACATTPVINAVTMKTNAIVTTSRRATDTSTIIAILVNQNTIIGAGGLELTYPAGYTLTVSRRASNTSSVIAILVNKSMPVIINP